MAQKQAHTAFVSLISMLALAVGVAVLLISLALLSGLQGEIKGRLIASSPQLLIEPTGRSTIEGAEPIAAAARALGITTVNPIVSGFGWGGNESERRGRPLRIRSYQPGREPASGPLEGRTRIPLDSDEPRILLTRDYAAAIGLTLGDQITLIVPRTKLTPFGPVPVWRKYRVARLIAPSSEEQQAEGMLPFDEASSLLGTGGRPTTIEMFGAPTERTEAIQAQLAAGFPTLLVKTWKEINRPLFLALRLEKIVMFATISLIIFVAALNLISSLSMLIVEKRPQVGVLRTLGATEGSILKIFLAVGLLIGLSGTVAGNILGLGISWTANHYHLIPLPRDIYFINYLPFQIDVEDVVGVNVIAVLLSVIGTWYPARVASRLDPITAIKEE
jgi:lipoprotein-releasing system permease protein